MRRLSWIEDLVKDLRFGARIIHRNPAFTLVAILALSESIWRRRFGASPAALGRTILVNGAPAIVIGVMPDAIRFPRRETEIWTNLPLIPPTRYGPWFYRGVARLKPGMTI